jgi:CheY-like chemotaxis protein
MKAPVAIFPTQSLMIDDDTLYTRLFTKNMLRNEGISIIPSNVDLTNIILKQANNDFIYLNEPSQIITANDLSKKPCEISRQLQETVSVLIADFHMPDMDGLEFFANIKSPFIYKILVSNFIEDEYLEKISNAVNEGIINAFLDKKKDLYKNLKKSITKGQNHFFTLLSNQIFHPDPAMKDPDFSKFIWDMIEKIGPDTMHADEKICQFSFKNKDTNKTLLVTTIEEINNILNSYQAEVASKHVIKNLSSHNFILACKDPFSIDGSEWDNFLQPAKKIRCRFNDYLFTVIDENIYEQDYLS